MLKTHTIPSNAIILISTAAILVIVIALGVIGHLMTTSTASFPSSPAEKSVANIVVPASVPATTFTTNSVYISEQSLWNSLEFAYERHQTALVHKLQRILNGRYERRCCGLPY